MSSSAAGYMRTVYAGETLALAPVGRAASAVPLTWPNKYAAESLDYTVDFSAYFAGEATADSLVSATAGATPADTALVLSNLVVAGQTITLTIAGGTPNAAYQINVVGISAAGRHVGALVSLYVPPAVFTSGASTSGSSN